MKKVIIYAIFVLACSVSAFAQTSIRQIDFNNFTYKTFCGNEDQKNIAVKGGEFFEEKNYGDNATRIHFKIFSTTYGDLNNDGKEEAFVLSLCNSCGEAYFSEGYV